MEFGRSINVVVNYFTVATFLCCYQKFTFIRPYIFCCFSHLLQIRSSYPSINPVYIKFKQLNGTLKGSSNIDG